MCIERRVCILEERRLRSDAYGACIKEPLRCKAHIVTEGDKLEIEGELVVQLSRLEQRYWRCGNCGPEASVRGRREAILALWRLSPRPETKARPQTWEDFSLLTELED